MFYTYIWKDADGVPFYVGKGKNRRAYAIVGRSLEFLAIHAAGGCFVEIADEFMLESQAHAHEVELIELYGRRDYGGTLVNKTDGGEGTSGASKETRAKISATHKGKAKSPEWKAKVSAALMGHEHSDVSLAKIAAASLGRRHTEESRRKISIGLTGRPVSYETRTKLNGQTRSPEARLRIRAGMLMSGPRLGRAFKGVSVNRDRFCASICIDGETKNLGRFATPEQAARAYDAAAIAAWGAGNCYLNFPEEHRQVG